MHKRPTKCQVGNRTRLLSVRVYGGLARSRCYVQSVGAERKKAIGTEKHVHPLEEMDGLPSGLEKKLDRDGNTITGDLRVAGNTRMKNLSIEEDLEVPELINVSQPF